MEKLIPINYEVVKSSDVYKKVFNAFFEDYKTQAEVVREIYYQSTGKNTGYISRCFNEFKKLGYLDGPKTVDRPRTRGGKKRKRKKHSYTQKMRFCYRANLQPFFEWLDYKANGNDFNKEVSEEIKHYLIEFFDVLDKNRIPRSTIIGDKDADVITNICNLLLTIQFLALEGRGDPSFGKNWRYTPLIKKSDGTPVELPDPHLFSFENPNTFTDALLGIKRIWRIEPAWVGKEERSEMKKK